ncbi:MAG: hypothetical protein WDW36_002335 [Sanguina aurantia]
MKKGPEHEERMGPPPARHKVTSAAAAALKTSNPLGHVNVPGNAVVAEVRKRSMALQQKSDHDRKADRINMKTKMNFLLKEIDSATGHPISGGAAPIQFLDTCCAPGGFCEYTLAYATNSRGLGFSLSPLLGGHTPEIPSDTPRFHLHYADTTEVAGGPGDAPTRVNDLIILDGSFLGGKEWITKETDLSDELNPAFNRYKGKGESHLALIIAQLVVMGNNLKGGGTMLLRLSMHADEFVSGLLCLFRRVFDGTITNFKPRLMHTCASSYYVVAQGFNPEILADLKWNEHLGALLARLRAGEAKPWYVPFPGLEESTEEGLRGVWDRSLRAYHVPLQRFLKHIEAAIKDKERLDALEEKRPRKGRFIEICNSHTLLHKCLKMNCPQAHTYAELHPLVQKAFLEPLGLMHKPGDVPMGFKAAVDGQDGHSWSTQDTALSETLVRYHQGNQGTDWNNEVEHNNHGNGNGHGALAVNQQRFTQPQSFTHGMVHPGTMMPGMVPGMVPEMHNAMHMPLGPFMHEAAQFGSDFLTYDPDMQQAAFGMQAMPPGNHPPQQHMQHQQTPHVPVHPQQQQSRIHTPSIQGGAAGVHQPKQQHHQQHQRHQQQETKHQQHQQHQHHQQHQQQQQQQQQSLLRANSVDGGTAGAPTQQTAQQHLHPQQSLLAPPPREGGTAGVWLAGGKATLAGMTVVGGSLGMSKLQVVNKQGALTGGAGVVRKGRGGLASGVDLLGCPVGAVDGGGANAGLTPLPISGYQLEGLRVVVTANRRALQAVLRFLNG